MATGSNLVYMGHHPLVMDWLAWGMRERGWANTTCVSYRRRVTAWLAWCKENGIRQERVRTSDVRAWLATLPAGATRHAFSAVLAWFDWRCAFGKQRSNPVREIPRAPARRVIPRSLDVDQARAVLTAAGNHGPKWSCYVSLMLYCGLRRTEACGLRWVDIEGGDQWLRVLGKGSRERIMPVHNQLRVSLVRWRSTHVAGVWIFPGRYGGRPMSLTTASKRIRVILDEAGLPQATGHWLRHSFATRMIDLGRPLPDVMAALGHSTLSSTTVYTRARPHTVQAAVEAIDF